MIVAYAILTCDKYKDRLQGCLNTWAKNIKYMTIMGSSYIEDDCYGNIHLKFKRLIQECDLVADWYIITDDDTFMIVDKLERALALREDVGGVAIGHNKTDGTFPGFRGGCGIAINREGMRMMQQSDLTVLAHPADVNLSNQCLACGVKVIDVSKTLLNRGAAEKDLRGTLCSMHYMSPNDMRRLQLIFGMP